MTVHAALAAVVLALVPACAVRRAETPPPPQRALGGAGKLQEETHVHREPGRTEQQTRMMPVLKTVTRYEYQCRMVTKPVMRSETVYEYKYDYATKSTRSVPTTRMVTSYQPQNECRTVPVTKQETQYEAKTETRYIPPREHVTKVYDKDTVLIEAEPEVLVSPAHRAE